MATKSSDTVNSLQQAEPTPYVYRGTTTALGDRNGQSVRLLWQRNGTAFIEFEDGLRSHVPRYVIRRKKRGET